jgi:hypothetical protein
MYNNDIPTRAELPSQAQLLRSTGIAILTAGVMLITVILPSEYGMDPTGVGKVLGLTAMGNIKASLAAEATAGKEKPAPVAAVGATPAGEQVARSDEMIVALKPGEGTEVKMAMLKGATVKYEWKTDGGLVNHDTHGDPANGPANTYHRYLKEKQVNGNSGEFTAVFDGNHGWFWRNRSDSDVKITLKTTGVYASIKKMM